MSTERELTNDELDAVSGGAFPFVHVQVAMSSSRDGGSVDLQPLGIVKLCDAATP